MKEGKRHRSHFSLCRSRLVACLALGWVATGCTKVGEIPSASARNNEQLADQPTRAENPRPQDLESKTSDVRKKAVRATELRDQLDSALREDDFELAERLVQEGADVNLPFDEKEGERKGESLLHAASSAFPDRYNDNVKVVRFLVDSGADVNARNAHGWPAVAEAIWAGNMDLVMFFQDQGVDINMTFPGPWPNDTDNFTLLHIAAMKSRTEPVAWLLGQGVEVNAQTDDGDTALMFAANSGNHNVVKVLLDAGADSSIRNVRDELAVDRAMRRVRDYENDPNSRSAFEKTVEILHNSAVGQQQEP